MFETDVHVEDAPDGTRERLLEAAGEVFAERGFREATVREICRRAAANVASVNYHFGGKERLYADVLQHVDRESNQRHPQVAPEAAALPAADRLRWFVRQFMRRMYDGSRPAWHERIMAREMIEPTPALGELFDRNIRPRAQFLQAIVRELLGDGADEARVHRCAASVVGQCLFYWHCRPMLGRVMPHAGPGVGGVDALADHIADFSLGALRCLAPGGGEGGEGRGSAGGGGGAGGGGTGNDLRGGRVAAPRRRAGEDRR